MIEPVGEPNARDGDAEWIGIGEVRQALLPGGCSWRKITSRSGPCSACQVRTRRSRVRRVAAGKSRCRSSISAMMLTGRSPGAASSSGTISLSQIAASGSGLRRPRGVCI
jgi:hypothetical protein